MITFTIGLTNQGQNALAQMQSFPTRLLNKLVKTLDMQNQLTVSTVQQKRLSFPKSGPSTLEGLRVQSNTLRKSVARVPATLTSDGISSAVKVGTNVRYAAVHEFGFTGTVQIKAHVRKKDIKKSFTTFGFKKTTKKVGEQETHVKSHSRHVNFPARRMFQRTLEERRGAYVQAISKDVVNEWNAQKEGNK